MHRSEVSSFAFQGQVVQQGMHADDLLEIMPRIIMIKDPVILGKDADGLIVEWHYSDVVFTLARAAGINPVTGYGVIAYYVQKIEIKLLGEPEEQGNEKIYASDK